MRMRAAGEAIAVVAGAAALAAALTWPLAATIGTASRLDSGDCQFAVWNHAWVARALVRDPGGLFDANIFHPNRSTLAYSEPMLLGGALAIPVYWSTRNPVLAYNAVLLFALASSAVGAYYLARYISGSRAGAAAAGVAFAFSPFMLSWLPNMHLMLAAGFPCGLLALHRFVDRRSLPRALALGLVLALQALATGYYGVYIGLVTGFGAIFYAISRRLYGDWRYWSGLAVAAGAAAILVLPLALAFFAAHREIEFARSMDEARHYAADWRSYLASPARAHAWLQRRIGRTGDVLFPGFIPAVLACAGVASLLRARPARDAGGAQSPADGTPLAISRPRETALFYLLLGGLALWASFGPRAGLYAALFHAVPLFALLRAPARLGVLVVLAVSVLGSVAVAKLAQARFARAGRGRILVIALPLLIAAELAAIPLRLRRATPTEPAYQMLAVLPHGPVASFPFFTVENGLFRHTLYMLKSTTHWQPLINGYSDYIPPDFRKVASTLREFPTHASFDVLRQRRARYVVLHLPLYDGPSRHRVLAELDRYREYLRPLVKEGDVRLYEIVAFPK